jgi:hypothetical protein
MSNLSLTIGDESFNLEIKEFRGQRVVTLKDVDILHRRPEGTANRTFRSNSKRMIENEDYFRRNTSEAFKEFGIKAPNGLVLLTESGYLMLVKTFTDELAWQVQRQLVRNYFKAKEIESKAIEVVQIPQMPTTIEDILLLAIGSMKDMKKEMSDLRDDNRKLSLVVDNEIWITDHQKADIQEAVNKRVGLLKSEGLDAHFRGVYSSLNTFFNVPKYDKIKRVDYVQAMALINNWLPKKKSPIPDQEN